MVDDANITQDDIADSVSILSVTFITLQPFSAAIGRRVGPKYWIACMMTAWGAVCMAHAGTKNRGTLIALRLLLGAFEAGFVPTSFVRNLESFGGLTTNNICSSTTCPQSIRSTHLGFD
jgi:MFS family permease